MVSNWMEKIVEIICFERSKNEILETLKNLIKFGTDLNFISEFIEFVYECKICDSFSISMLISNLFLNRKYFSKKFLNQKNHKFCQNIFIESFNIIQLQNNVIDSFENIELVFNNNDTEEEEIILQIPNIFVNGIIDFISFPIGKNSSYFINNLTSNRY